MEKKKQLIISAITFRSMVLTIGTVDWWIGILQRTFSKLTKNWVLICKLKSSKEKQLKT